MKQFFSLKASREWLSLPDCLVWLEHIARFHWGHFQLLKYVCCICKAHHFVSNNW